MTIDEWRSNQTPDGWKLPESKMRKRDEGRSQLERYQAREGDAEIPLLVKAKPRLFLDIEALWALSEVDAPLGGWSGPSTPLWSLTGLRTLPDLPMEEHPRWLALTSSISSLGNGLLR